MNRPLTVKQPVGEKKENLLENKIQKKEEQGEIPNEKNLHSAKVLPTFTDFGIISYTEDKDDLVSFSSIVNNYLKENGFKTKFNCLDQSIVNQNKSAITNFDKEFFEKTIAKKITASCFVVTEHKVVQNIKMVGLVETVQLNFSGTITIINIKDGSKKEQAITVLGSGGDLNEAKINLQNKVVASLQNLSGSFDGCK